MRRATRLLIPLLMGCGISHAAEDSGILTLDPVSVQASQESDFVEQAPEETATRSLIPKRSMEILSGPSRTNPYKALDLLPSVHSEGSDAFGMSMDQNSLRIRGQIGDTFTRLSRTIEGLPLGVNVGQGAMGNLIDLENLTNLSLIRGAVPVDRGFGFGTTAGAMEQSLLWGSEQAGATLTRSDGSEQFNRTFIRLDSGELPTKTRLFTSASYTGADKWRGAGNGERVNVSLGGSQQLPGDGRISLYGVFNTFKQYSYRPLTYDQTRSDSFYRDYDYATSLTSPGSSSTTLANSYYYGYNRQRFDEYAVFSLLELKPTASSYLTIKPYYAGTDGYRYFSSGTTNANAVINRTDINQQQYGVTAEYGLNIGPSLVKLGYWFQNADTMPPPTSQRSYSITSSGLAFKRWSMLTRVEGRSFHEPYLAVNSRFGKLRVDAGLKYVRIDLPGVTGYSTAGLGDMSYSQALAASSGAVAGLRVGGATQDAWLPYLGMRYDFDEHNSLRLTYGRNYAEGWLGPLFSTYKNNQAAFTCAGISLRDLWKGVKLEISDNLDLGARIGGENWHISPTLFFARFYDKQVMVYDSQVNASYYQSNASAESMGAELEVALKPVSWLTFFGSASYNRFRFDDDIRSASGTTLQSRGKQVADAPQWMGKAGMTLSWNGFSLTPVVRYIGERYGDIENRERIAAYEVVDLNLEYRKRNVLGFKELTFGLNMTNLFDKRYVSIIKNNQDVSEALATSYYPGAPFTVVGSVGISL